MADDGWTPDAIKALRRSYGNTDNAALAEQLCVSLEELERKAAEFALSKDKRTFKGRPMPRWTPTQIEEFVRLYPKLSNIELALRIGRSTKAIVSKAHAMKLKKSEERLEEMGRENVSCRPGRTRYTGANQ